MRRLTLLTSAATIVGGLSHCGNGTTGGTQPITLAGLQIEPHQAAIDTASSQRFSAVAQYSDGSTGPIAVIWSATAGTVDSSGFYLPPTIPGGYSVAARITGTTLSDVATVTVTAVPPANPPFPHEPAGFTPLTERSFTIEPESGWTLIPAAGVAGDFSIVQDATGPKSPPGAGQVTFPAGFLGGGEPVEVRSPVLLAGTRLYISCWVRLSSNWFGHAASGVNSVLQVWMAGVNRVTLSAQGSDSAALKPEVLLHQIASAGGYRWLRPNQRQVEIVRGQWQRWEVVLKANSDGQANGSVEWWIDGARVGSYADVEFVNSGVSRAWERVEWAPTWGGGGGVIPADQDQRMDDLYLSGAP
jgi:hypothetical protein